MSNIVTEEYSERRLQPMKGVSPGISYEGKPPYKEYTEGDPVWVSEPSSRAILRDNLHYYGRDLINTNPQKLFNLLNKCKELKTPVNDILNDNISPESYSCWFSGFPQCLAYIVGLPKDKEEQMGVSQEFGIDMLELMVELGADLTITDYYDKTILENIKLIERHNDQFVKRLKELLRN
jgi:hypothetical protein